MYFVPENDKALQVDIDLSSSVHAFDVPPSHLRVQFAEDGIIMDFISAKDGSILTSFVQTYTNMYYAMLHRDKERAASMARHPVSFQVIDGGAK